MTEECKTGKGETGEWTSLTRSWVSSRASVGQSSTERTFGVGQFASQSISHKKKDEVIQRAKCEHQGDIHHDAYVFWKEASERVSE